MTLFSSKIVFCFFFGLIGTIKCLEFIEFGVSAGDTFLTNANDQSFISYFEFDLLYFGNKYNSCFININGFITFDLPYLHSPPKDTNSIVPFINDLSTFKGGNISFRTINDLRTLTNISNEVSRLLYSSKKQYIARNAFVITWNQVEGNILNGSVSFQVILSTDSSYESYLTINFGKIELSSFQQYYEYVENNFYNGKQNLTDPLSSSNVNLKGKWIFKLFDSYLNINCSDLIIRYGDVIFCDFMINLNESSCLFVLDYGQGIVFLNLTDKLNSNSIETISINTTFDVGTHAIFITDIGRNYTKKTYITVYGDPIFNASCPSATQTGVSLACKIDMFFFNIASFLYDDGSFSSYFTFTAAVLFGNLTDYINTPKFNFPGLYNISLWVKETDQTFLFQINVTSNPLYTQNGSSINLLTSCPNGWKQNESSCYLYVKSRKDYNSAQSDCISKGGDLVSINSRSELNFLTKTIQSNGIWLGLLAFQPKIFHWIAYSNYTFNWCTNEPNNYKAPRNTFGEACAIIVGDCLWDFDCATNSNGYVCEKADKNKNCAKGWTKYGTSCYSKTVNKINYKSAETICENESANLVVINSDYELNFLVNFIGSNIDKFWIGAVAFTPKQFHWIDDTSNYSIPWDNKMPNNYGGSDTYLGQACAVLKASYVNDMPCTNSYSYICEIKLLITTTSTTTTTISTTTTTISTTTSTTASTRTTTPTTNKPIYLSQMNLSQIMDILKSNIDLSNCLNNCSNSGQCEFFQNKFSCVCSTYYIGASCAFDIRPCSSSPCLNNGTCIQNLTDLSYYCDCGLLFNGENCEIKMDVCQNETCSNNGMCIDLYNKPKCKCFDLYSGTRCETVSESLTRINKIKTTSIIVAIIIICLFYLFFVFLDVTRKCTKRKRFRKIEPYIHKIRYQN